MVLIPDKTVHYLVWSSHSFFEMVLTPFFIALIFRNL
nr:MAG TPA: hypothetical protein [Caudoviricetes sp.]